MPPAPGEFVVPSVATGTPLDYSAQVPVHASQAMVPVSSAQQAAYYSAMAGPPMGGAYGEEPWGAQPQMAAQRVAAPPAAQDQGAAQASPNMLGLTILSVGAGAALGAIFGDGPLSILGGAILGGAAVNGLRAAKEVTQGNQEADKAAVVDGTFAIGGAALAVYLLYKANSEKGAGDEEEEDDDAKTSSDEKKGE